MSWGFGLYKKLFYVQNNVTLRGGGEIYGENFGGIYVEVGYIGQKTNLNYPVSGIIIQAGWRIFFWEYGV